MKFSKHLYALAIAGVVSIAIPNTTQAGLTFDLQEVGSDVVLTFVSGGSINLTGLSYIQTTSSLNGTVNPLGGFSDFFKAGSGSFDSWQDGSGGFTGPSSFGTGFGGSGSSNTGGTVGFGANSSFNNVSFMLPNGYTSGSPINSTSTTTFLGQSLSTLGATAGTYVWTLTNTDTVTLNVIAASPVPEASGSVAGIGLAMAGLYQLRRRKAAVGKLSVES
jgi:hypothetical protein